MACSTLGFPWVRAGIATAPAVEAAKIKRRTSEVNPAGPGAVCLLAKSRCFSGSPPGSIVAQATMLAWRAHMEPAERIITFVLLLFSALVAAAGTGQKPTNTDSPIHLISCSIEKVNQCLAQESASGYVAIHIATTVMDRQRGTSRSGYGFVRSEDPVLVMKKSDAPKRQTVAIIDDLAKRETQLNQAGAAG